MLEDEEFTCGEWREDVANGDTRLGYAAWVKHNKAPEGLDSKPDVIVKVRGGVIDDIVMLDGCQDVWVHDYDCDGVDPGDLQKDDEGCCYVRSVW